MKKQRGVTISTPKEPLIQDKSKGVPLQTKNPIKGFKSHLKPLYIKSAFYLNLNVSILYMKYVIKELIESQLQIQTSTC
jgi:hypothetical protein